MDAPNKPGLMKNLLTFVFVFLLVGMLLFKNPSCRQGESARQVPPGARIEDVVIAGHRVRAEVVATPAQRQRGLMGRTELELGSGMLFVFDEPAELSFWMKDTTIPLSIAFIAEDGRIVRIAKMTPLDRTTVLSGAPARYALEVRQGWFEERRIKAGAMVTLPDLTPPAAPLPAIPVDTAIRTDTEIPAP